MGIGAAILVVAGLALFGGGKKDNQQLAAQNVDTASAVAESPALDISTTPNAQIFGSETAATTADASEAQFAPRSLAASESFSRQEQRPIATQAAVSGGESSSAVPRQDDDSGISKDVPASLNGESTEPTMLKREHH
jgi:hypothetical protein